MNGKKELLVTDIQRFCLHDGPGIRTTVFLKGCTLHCPWCCNPENISPNRQFYFKKDKCMAKNGRCPYGECPFTVAEDVRISLARLTSLNYKQCKSGAIGIYGKPYITDELLCELMKDYEFWGESGGVTFSGGEPLMQMEALEEVLKALKSRGINLCAETALYVPTGNVEKAVRYFDEMFVDVKLLDKQRCKGVLGGNLYLYLQNLDMVYNSGVKVCFRHPQIKGYTDDRDTEESIRELLAKYPMAGFQELEEHHLGDDKYFTLGKK